MKKVLLFSKSENPNLVTNGNFSNGTASWTEDRGNFTVVSGEANLQPQSSLSCFISQSLSTLNTGDSYRITFDYSTTVVGLRVTLGSSRGSGANGGFSDFNTTGSKSFDVTLSDTRNFFISFITLGSGNSDIEIFDNVTVTKI